MLCLVLLGVSGTSNSDNDVTETAHDTSSRLRAWRAQFSGNRWVLNPERCATSPESYACLADYSFELGGPNEDAIKDPCSLLHAKGIQHLTFCGDSYIRGMYIGFLSLLSNNFKDAALGSTHIVSEGGHLECHSDKQYSSRACRSHLQKEKTICDGRLRVSYVSWHDLLEDQDNIPGLPWCIPWEGNRAEVFDSSNVVVWFGGNHPANMDYSIMPGDLDATLVDEYVLQRFCPRWSSQQKSKLIWVNSHASLPQHVVDSLPADHPLKEAYPHYVRKNVFGPKGGNAEVQTYNEDMVEALARVCNISRIVDVFNMTLDSLHKVPGIHHFTHDGRHWSTAVNVVKAKLLLVHLSRTADGEFTVWMWMDW